jgi:ParB-like chromosome segregation protein Spo0J
MMAKKRAAKAGELEHIAEAIRSLAVPLAEIGEDPRNARTHGEENLAAIAASLERFGQLKPAVANRTTGRLEAGHGMLAAARRLGWTHLAVVWVEHTDEEARDFGLADNRTAELAEWDDQVLDELLAELREDEGGEDFAAAMLLGELEESIDEEVTAGPEEDGAGEDGGGEDEGAVEKALARARGRDVENVTLSFSADELAILSQAIDRAKEQFADVLQPPNVDAQALVRICGEFLERSYRATVG